VQTLSLLSTAMGTAARSVFAEVVFEFDLLAFLGASFLHEFLLETLAARDGVGIVFGDLFFDLFDLFGVGIAVVVVVSLAHQHLTVTPFAVPAA
jgi:hypothetical protein